MSRPIKITLTLSIPLTEEIERVQNKRLKEGFYLPYTDIVRRALEHYFKWLRTGQEPLATVEETKDEH